MHLPIGRFIVILQIVVLAEERVRLAIGTIRSARRGILVYQRRVSSRRERRNSALTFVEKDGLIILGTGRTNHFLAGTQLFVDDLRTDGFRFEGLNEQTKGDEEERSAHYAQVDEVQQSPRDFVDVWTGVDALR